MADKYSKEQLRNPDVMTAELKKGFEWTTQHVRLVLGLVVALLIVGGGWSAFSWMNNKKENELQTEFFKAEKEYLKKKEAFDRFEATAGKPKEAKKDPKSKDEVEPQGEKASGDLEKDYGNTLADLNKIIQSHPDSKAAVLSALTLADVYLKYNKPDEGLAVLQKVKHKKTTLHTLALNLEAGLWANKNDCNKAVSLWNDVLSNREATFMHNEARLRQALCYESMNEPSKAEDNYNKVIADAKDSNLGKTAEKYLRLLKTKTN